MAKKDIYSYQKEGGYSFFGDPTPGAVDGLGQGADWNKLAAYANPGLEALEAGATVYMSDILTEVSGVPVKFIDGTVSAPGASWGTEIISGLYKVGTNRFGFSINSTLEVEFNSSGLLISDMTQNSVLFAGASGQVSQDNTNFSFTDSTDTLKVGGGVRVGTVTDTATAGDFAAGLTGASRLFFDQSDQSLSIYDSSNNQDILLKANGDSWYNGSGNFGFGTITPDVKVDIEATATQLRLTYSSGSIYTDISTQSNGNLYLSPIGSSNRAVYMDLDMPGGDVLFYIANADDTSTSSHARIQIVSSTFSGTGGDPLIEWATDTFGSDTHFVMGIDNSDSDKLKISSGTALGTNDFLTIAISGDISSAVSAATQRTFTFQNSDAASLTAQSVIGIYTNGAGSGDPRIHLRVTGVTEYSIGIDNSDSDILKISASNALGTADCMRIASTGATTVVQWLNGGTATDAATQGDLAFGLTGASRVFFDQSLQTLSIYDSSGNEDISLDAAGASWYNGAGNFGIGTTGPDAKLDVLSTSAQLRLTHTDGSVYCDIQLDSAGDLNFTPTGDSFSWINSGAGVLTLLNVINGDDTNGASHAAFRCLSGGASGGDPKFLFTVAGVIDWALGCDNSDSDKFKIGNSSNLGTNERFSITSTGSVICNSAAIATTATDGFLYVPSCAGTPTGVPTAHTGRIPIVVDSTNNKLYFYSGGSWRDAGP